MKRFDWDQVKTIIRYSLRIELRGRRQTKPGKRSYHQLISIGVLYLLSGFSFGMIAGRMTDSFTIAFAAASYFMVMIASYLLLEYPQLVTGPEDFLFYAVRPVHPVTFFCGKIAALASVTSLHFLLFALPLGVVQFVVRRSVMLALGTVLAVYWSGLLALLFVIVFYGLLVKWVPYRRIVSVASFLQLVLVFANYSVIFFAGSLIRKPIDVRLALEPWLLAVPSAWPSALFRLTEDVLALPAFCLGLVALPLLVVLALRFLSVDYVARISENAVQTVKKTKRSAGASRFWRTPESYVITRLIANHFRYNPQFRMGILVIIPVTILYFFMAVFYNKAAILDPFTPAGRQAFAGTYLLYIAIGFFPMMIKNNLSYSNESEASWLFFTSPASRIRLIDAGKHFILVFFLFPYLVVFAMVFFLFTGALLHTLMHFLVLSLLSLILVDVFMYFFAEMPFVKSPQKGQRTAKLYLRMLLGFLMPLPVQLFVQFLYPSLAGYLLLVATLCVCLVIFRFVGRKFAARVLDRVEYLA